MPANPSSRNDRMPIRPHVLRIAKFGTVGVVNTAIDFALFAFLFYQAGWPLLVANSAAYLAAVTNSYLLNKSWTFGDTSHGREALARGGLFFGLNLIGLALGNLTVWGLSYALPVLAAKAASIVVVFTWNYWSNARFVYRAG